MFQFPEFPALQLLIDCRLRKHSLAWVSPFGYLRIITLARFPVAFRSATRPSSALDATGIPRAPLVA
jgi:hypothetical protein